MHFVNISFLYDLYINQKYNLLCRRITKKSQNIIHPLLLTYFQSYNNGTPYLFGGFVRSIILGDKEINDIDIRIVTGRNLHSEAKMLERKILPYGIKFYESHLENRNKSLYVSYLIDKIKYDFTFLSDLHYPQVDFTINTVYLNLKSNRLHDPYHGLVDYNNRLIRTCVDPVTGFEQEKGSLIFRLAEVKTITGFTVEHNTYEAMNRSLCFIESYFKEISRSVYPQNIFLVKRIYGGFSKRPKEYMQNLIDFGIMKKILDYLAKYNGIENHRENEYINPYSNNEKSDSGLKIFLFSIFDYFKKYYGIKISNFRIKKLLMIDET